LRESAYRTQETTVSAPHQRNVTTDKVSGVVTNIQVYSLHDGPGVRTLVFLKGCPLRCDWCCNPECITPDLEVEFYKSKCIQCGACLKACSQKAINPDLALESGYKIDKDLCNECGDCVPTCPVEALKLVGKVMTVDEVMTKVRKDKYFYLTSRGGLTVSGGEPLYQFPFTLELLKRAHAENIDTAIETCGYAPWKRYQQLLPYLNLVLYDIKHMDPVKHKQMTGVSNKLILNNLKKLSQTGIPLVIRLPLIPEFNLDRDNIVKTAEFVSKLNNITEVNLMPFHQLGKDKYYRLCRDYSLQNLKALDSDAEGTAMVRDLKNTLEAYGLKVTVGG
jgi:pyruvate formate lyase activating enzyme